MKLYAVTHKDFKDQPNFGLLAKTKKDSIIIWHIFNNMAEKDKLDVLGAADKKAGWDVRSYTLKLEE